MRNTQYLYILSGNLSTTPRAVKSIMLSRPEHSYILSVNRSEKWFEKDKQIILNDSLINNSIDLGRKSVTRWLYASILHKFCRLIYSIFPGSKKINAYASEKASILLHRKLKKLKKRKFDIVIGHGYGALFPAWKYAKLKGIAFGFDVEDYHPGEFARSDAQNEKKRRVNLLAKLLPDALFVTFASSLIEKKTLNLTGPLKGTSVILNSFPEKEFHPPSDGGAPLKLIWFSQKISYGRGLEFLFSVLGKIDDYQLTIIGDPDPKFISAIPGNIQEKITIIPPMAQSELHKELARHHLGLALETAADENRELCLTNKIIAYTQAGLYVLATDTPAQKLFIETDPERGVVCGQTGEQMSEILQSIIARKDDIIAKAPLRYESARSLAWEKESEKLQKLWNGHF